MSTRRSAHRRAREIMHITRLQGLFPFSEYLTISTSPSIAHIVFEILFFFKLRLKSE